MVELDQANAARVSHAEAPLGDGRPDPDDPMPSRSARAAADASSEVALLLVDGMNLLWRAAFGFPARIRSRDGRDLTAVFGFFALLRKAHRLVEPAECVVVFDGELAWTTRAEAEASYKANRAGTDCSHLAWLPAITEGLSLLGVEWEETELAEADDVIATVASRHPTRETYVMSTDRDFYQLVGERCRVLNTTRSPSRAVVTPEEIRRRFAVEPSQWCDFVALVGDRSDNIPGVRGIGPVRAASLLRAGSTLETLTSIDVSPLLRRLVIPNLDSAIRQRELLRLRRDAPTGVAPAGGASAPLPLAAQILEGLELW